MIRAPHCGLRKLLSFLWFNFVVQFTSFETRRGERAPAILVRERYSCFPSLVARPTLLDAQQRYEASMLGPNFGRLNM